LKNHHQIIKLSNYQIKKMLPLDLQYFKRHLLKDTSIVLDIRPIEQFLAGFVPRSIPIRLDNDLEHTMAKLAADKDIPVILLGENMEAEKAMKQLEKMGYTNIIGYLDGGFETWKSEGEDVVRIANSCPINLRVDLENKSIIDVRSEAEYQAGHIGNAKNIPLESLKERMGELDKSEVHYVYCQFGADSLMASSILMKHGFENIINVKKGYEGITNPGKTCCCSKAKEIEN
jgi:hydroxyacylglutathione hydrolase